MSEKVNKMSVMREAITALGKDASPKDIAGFFAGKGVEISPAMISNYKSSVLKGDAGGKKKGKPGRKPKAATADPFPPIPNTNGHAQPDVAMSPASLASYSFTAGEIKAARGFVESIGKDRVVHLLEALK